MFPNWNLNKFLKFRRPRRICNRRHVENTINEEKTFF
jgi:hypothetical protein